MNIHTDSTVRLLQAVAMIVGTAMLLWSLGFSTFFGVAQAAQITNASDTLSNSATGSVSNHTIVFTLPNGATASSTIELTFDAGFTTIGGNIVEDDVDVDVNGTASTTAAVAAAGTFGVFASGNVIRLTTATDTGLASSSVLTIRIGTNAVDSGTGANQITNPSATSSYPIDIDGGVSANPIQDSGQVRVAIIDEVTVTASVDTSLQFTVSGVAQGQTVNGAATSTQGASTDTTLPFGTLIVSSSTVLAQDLSVATNAANGFSVTVEQTAAFASTLGDTIDGFIDGSNTTTPTGWASPAATVSNTDTYGHWGLTSDDGAVAARTDQFTADTWVSPSTTPIAIMGHTGPSDGTTPGEGQTRVGYQVEISALQEAGNDYNTTLRYIATPTF